MGTVNATQHLELEFSNRHGAVIRVPWTPDYREQKRLRAEAEMQSGAVLDRIGWAGEGASEEADNG